MYAVVVPAGGSETWFLHEPGATEEDAIRNCERDCGEGDMNTIDDVRKALKDRWIDVVTITEEEYANYIKRVSVFGALVAPYCVVVNRARRGDRYQWVDIRSEEETKVFFDSTF